MKRAFPLFVMLILCGLLSLAAAPANAAEERKSPSTPEAIPKTDAAPKPAVPPEAKPSAAAETADEGFDIVLLLDSSGSMRKTDPKNYRTAAARLFISLLGKNDRISIVSFGDSAHRLLPLTQNTPAHRDRLFATLGKVSSKEPTTHIHEGVKQGLAEFGAPSRRDRVMLLMSDGKLTLGSGEKEAAAQQELSALLKEAAKGNIRLYSIAFTEQSDMKLLEDMAKATGGFSKLASSDKDIHVIFSSIFEKMKSPDTVPIEGDAFTIDRDIEEAIVVITKKEGTATTLIDPAGRKNTPARFAQNIQWYESKLFDMITVKAPAAGRWKVSLSAKEGNKVFVITDLRLKSSFDRNYVSKGDRLKVSAWLEKEGAVLAEPGFLEQVSFFVEVAAPPGADDPAGTAKDEGKGARLALRKTEPGPDQEGGGRADAGVYSGEFLIDRAGEYTLKITAEGKTFKREKVFQFKAGEPAAPQAAAPAAAPAEGKKGKAGGDAWTPVLVKFGIINFILLLVVVAFYFGGKAKGAKKAKQKKGKK
ncbi:MAG: VWA domain-containing protein [Nitrospirota bacterium]